MYSRMGNGVKSRNDGGGDAWALDHRKLGPTFNMQDIDGVFGTIAFGSNTGESLFIEYQPDAYRNKGNVIRQFSTVAVFDRKTSRQAAEHSENSVSTAFYLHLCRQMAMVQPKPPRFFFVIGGQVPPWELVEININDGVKTERGEIDGNNMRNVWDTIGLVELRQGLRDALERE